MQRGKILVAEHQGAFVIKLIGDVRVTLCVAFDDYLENMLSDGDFQSVIIDLVEAEGIDSTTLGLLAKVSIRAKERYGYRPVIISTNENITRLITSMGFDMVFDIRTEAITDDDSLHALADTASSEEGVRERVLAAHRVLMGLNDDNRARFQELVTTLENVGP